LAVRRREAIYTVLVVHITEWPQDFSGPEWFMTILLKSSSPLEQTDHLITACGCNYAVFCTQVSSEERAKLVYSRYVQTMCICCGLSGPWSKAGNERRSKWLKACTNHRPK